MGRKKKAGISISLIAFLTFLYLFGNSVLDTANYLFNMNVPLQYYGILSFCMIIACILMLLRGKWRGS